MIKAAEVGDTSWELSVQVDQKEGVESMKFKLRVKGDLHVGGLMLKLVEKISKFSFETDEKLLCGGAATGLCAEPHPCLPCIFLHRRAIVL